MAHCWSSFAKVVSWLVDTTQISNDLNYVGQYWNRTTYDLWEEVSGSSFFTLQSQYRALVQGARLASKLELACPSCHSQAAEILCLLRFFWDGSSYVANINTGAQRSGVDLNLLLGSLVAFDVNATCHGKLAQPCSSRTLAAHKTLVDVSRQIYPINRHLKAHEAAHVGRYPEDVYQGGNPWFIGTFAAAELLYSAIAQWQQQTYVTVDNTSHPFFASLVPTIETGTYEATGRPGIFPIVVSAVGAYADDFLAKALEHLPSSGDLSEQYSRDNGYQLSALNLTWSFAAFLTATSRRAGFLPGPWGANDGPPAPATCAATSVKGVYRPAVAAGAPRRGGLCTIPVEFRVLAATYWGEEVLLYGNTTELGEWSVEQAWPLGAQDYTDGSPLWQLRVDIPADETVAYRYVRKGSQGELSPESQDRLVRLSGCGSELFVVRDAWQS